MAFDRAAYGAQVERILATDGRGLSALVSSRPAPTGFELSADWFSDASHPAGALAGLWLYCDGFEEAHSIAQDDGSREGSYWHAIVHRREPDAWNSGYWFDRVGKHPIFPAVAAAARELGYPGWQPKEFIRFCEQAQIEGGDKLKLALAVQRAEWEILFDYCARPVEKGKRN